MIIKPSSSLCNDYPAFSKMAHDTSEPIYITKDGEGDLVLLSIEAFENREKAIEKKIINDLTNPETIKPTLKHFIESGDEKMTELKLGKILRDMYDSAPKGGQVAQIHLFSIFYANDIEGDRLSKKEILKVAELPETYQTEISKGVRLADYVSVKDEQIRKIEDIESKYI